MVIQIHSLDEIRGWNAGLENYLSAVLKVLSGIALTLAAVGMFSVLAYTVDQRRSEFGVRLALGATPRTLVRLVRRRGVTLALAGVVIGVITSLMLVRYLQSLLYETPPHDPVVLIGVSVNLRLARPRHASAGGQGRGWQRTTDDGGGGIVRHVPSPVDPGTRVWKVEKQ